MLGATVLLATPFLIEQGTTQCADVPLGFFFLSSLVLLCLHEEQPRGSFGLTALAGMMAGFAAWTKNEGLLFLCIVIAARLLTFVRVRSRTPSEARTAPSRDWAVTTVLLAGMASAMLLMVYFKRFIAGPREYFSDSGTILHKLFIPARYQTVLKWQRRTTPRPSSLGSRLPSWR